MACCNLWSFKDFIKFLLCVVYHIISADKLAVISAEQQHIQQQLGVGYRDAPRNLVQCFSHARSGIAGLLIIETKNIKQPGS